MYQNSWLVILVFICHGVKANSAFELIPMQGSYNQFHSQDKITEIPLNATGTRTSEVNLILSESEQADSEVTLHWQKDQQQQGTLGAYINFSSAKLLPKTPVAIGLNIFIPAKLAEQKVWLRASLIDSNNKRISLSFNGEDEQLPGTGWHFFKAVIPPGYTPPYSIVQPLRVLLLAKNPQLNGQIKLKSLTALYDVNADLSGPEGELCEHNKRTDLLCIEVHDPSGLNKSKSQFFVDDEVVQTGIEWQQSRLYFNKAHLSSGWHKFTYRLMDSVENQSEHHEYFYHSGNSAHLTLRADSVIYPSRDAEVKFQLKNPVLDTTLLLSVNNPTPDVSYQLSSADPRLRITKQTTTARPTANKSAITWQLTTTAQPKPFAPTLVLTVRIKNDYTEANVALSLTGSIQQQRFSFRPMTLLVKDPYQLTTDWLDKLAAQTLNIVDHENQPASNVSGMISCKKANKILNLQFTTDKFGHAVLARGALKHCIANASLELTGSLGASRLQHIAVLGPITSLTAPLSYNTMTSNSAVTVQNTLTPLSTILDVTPQKSPPHLLAFNQGLEQGIIAITHQLKAQKDDTDSNVRIHLLGDTQTAADMNDYNGTPLVGQVLAQQMSQLPDPDLVMHVGDFTDDINRFKLVRQFLQQYNLSAQRNVPLVIAHGNHEISYAHSNKFAHLFSYHPDAEFTELADQQIFSFDYKQLHIAILNSELDTDAQWQSMMTWLANDMQNSQQPWKVVLLHRPPYAANPASGNQWVNRYLPSVVDSSGINLVISGHDHIYSRSKPLRSGKLDSTGATYLIAGSASKKFYDAGGEGIVPYAEVLFDDDKHVFTTLHFKAERLYLETRTTGGLLVDKAVINCCITYK